MGIEQRSYRVIALINSWTYRTALNSCSVYADSPTDAVEKRIATIAKSYVPVEPSRFIVVDLTTFHSEMILWTPPMPAKGFAIALTEVEGPWDSPNS